MPRQLTEEELTLYEESHRETVYAADLHSPVMDPPVWAMTLMICVVEFMAVFTVAYHIVSR